jgi:drug/metabolite transporter (DMT)-like permease
MIYVLIPLFSGILAFFFLDEKVSLIHFFSGVFIRYGIWMATRQKNVAQRVISIHKKCITFEKNQKTWRL